MGPGGVYEDPKARAFYSQSSKMRAREEVRRRVNLSAPPGAQRTRRPRQRPLGAGGEKRRTCAFALRVALRSALYYKMSESRKDLRGSQAAFRDRFAAKGLVKEGKAQKGRVLARIPGMPLKELCAAIANCRGKGYPKEVVKRAISAIGALQRSDRMIPAFKVLRGVLHNLSEEAFLEMLKVALKKKDCKLTKILHDGSLFKSSAGNLAHEIHSIAETCQGDLLPLVRILTSDEKVGNCEIVAKVTEELLRCPWPCSVLTEKTLRLLAFRRESKSLSEQVVGAFTAVTTLRNMVQNGAKIDWATDEQANRVAGLLLRRRKGAQTKSDDAARGLRLLWSLSPHEGDAFRALASGNAKNCSAEVKDTVKNLSLPRGAKRVRKSAADDEEMQGREKDEEVDRGQETRYQDFQRRLDKAIEDFAQLVEKKRRDAQERPLQEQAASAGPDAEALQADALAYSKLLSEATECPIGLPDDPRRKLLKYLTRDDFKKLGEHLKSICVSKEKEGAGAPLVQKKRRAFRSFSSSGPRNTWKDRRFVVDDPGVKRDGAARKRFTAWNSAVQQASRSPALLALTDAVEERPERDGPREKGGAPNLSLEKTGNANAKTSRRATRSLVSIVKELREGARPYEKGRALNGLDRVRLLQDAAEARAEVSELNAKRLYKDAMAMDICPVGWVNDQRCRLLAAIDPKARKLVKRHLTNLCRVEVDNYATRYGIDAEEARKQCAQTLQIFEECMDQGRGGGTAGGVAASLNDAGERPKILNGERSGKRREAEDERLPSQDAQPSLDSDEPIPQANSEDDPPAPLPGMEEASGESGWKRDAESREAKVRRSRARSVYPEEEIDDPAELFGE